MAIATADRERNAHSINIVIPDIGNVKSMCQRLQVPPLFQSILKLAGRSIHVNSTLLEQCMESSVLT